MYIIRTSIYWSRPNSVEDFPRFRSMREFHTPFRSSRHPPLKTSPLTEERKEFSHLSALEMGTYECDSTISPTFTNSGHGANLMGEDGRRTELPDSWQAGFGDKVGEGRPPISNSILAEVPSAPINYSMPSKEWAADKNCAESDSGSSRVDFMMMSDGPNCKWYLVLLKGLFWFWACWLPSCLSFKIAAAAKSLICCVENYNISSVSFFVG